MSTIPEPFYSMYLGQLARVGGIEWARIEIEKPEVIERVERLCADMLNDDDIMTHGNTVGEPWWEPKPMPPWAQPPKTDTALCGLATGPLNRGEAISKITIGSA